NLRRFAMGVEIDGFNQGFGAFALVRLDEAGNRTTQRRGGSGLVVAVLSAQPRGRKEEGALCCDLLIKNLHDCVERLGAHLQSFMPGGQAEPADRSLIVQRREPVNSLHWAGREPTLEGVAQRNRISGV